MNLPLESKSDCAKEHVYSTHFIEKLKAKQFSLIFFMLIFKKMFDVFGVFQCFCLMLVLVLHTVMSLSVHFLGFMCIL